MRYHFSALLGTLLTVQAASALASAKPVTDKNNFESAADPARPVVLIDIDRAIDGLSSPLETSTHSDQTPLFMHAQPPTADVMSLPPQPIPTPPAFAMGLSVVMGYAGYQMVRRLRAA